MAMKLLYLLDSGGLKCGTLKIFIYLHTLYTLAAKGVVHRLGVLAAQQAHNF